MMKQITLHLFLLLLLSGCSDQGKELEPVVDENIQLNISLKVKNLNTRAGQDISEKIDYLEVLVFEETEGIHGYSYRTTAVKKEQDHQYSLKLRPTEANITLLLVANHIDFQPLQVGYTIEQVREALIQPFTSEGITRIPMSGQITLTGGIDSDTTIDQEIILLRSVGAIQVELKTGIGALVSDWDNHFLLKSMQVYRASDKIQIIPDASSPTLPANANYTSSNVITSEEINPYLLSGLYIPESAGKTDAERKTDATCLIIGGIYLADNPANTITSYYRVDIKKETGNNETVYGEILRNNLYRIIIENVTGEGTEHPDHPDSSGGIEYTSWESSNHELEL